jgi:4-amino-4-deoxy-L-arabinose transferase-like glycosyltransferase
MRPTSEQAWWARFDPLIFVVGIVALIVYVLHGFDGGLNRDLGIYSYAGQQVAEGVPPYVGILNRAGPLAHFLPAVGVAVARAAGFDDVLGMRVVFMLIAVASVCALYALARDLFDSRLAGLVGAAALLSFYGYIELATYGPREKTAMVLFLVSTLLAITKQRWVTAGIFLSLTALTWQPAFLVGLTAAIATLIVLRASERSRAFVRFIVGGLIPASICIIYFALAGALREFFDAFLLINARYSSGDLFLPELGKNWAALKKGYGVSLWVLVVGLAALAILTFLAFRRGGWRAPVRVPVAAVGAAGVAALAWSLRDFNSWADAFVLLPLAAVGIGGIGKELIDRLPARAGLVLGLAWVIAAVAVAATYSTTHRSRRLQEQRAAVAAVLGQLPSDASIQSIGAPQALVLSGRRNPTRYQTFAQGLDLYMKDTWPGGLRGFAKWVGREEPTVITTGRRIPYWLRRTIKGEYRLAGSAPGWTWYVHRSVIP